MLEIITQSLHNDGLFLFCVYAGCGVLAIQFSLNFFSFTDGHNTEVESDEGKKLKWMSMQSIGGFLMMFGLSAITCKNEFKMSLSASLIMAVTVGLLIIFLTQFIFNSAKRLRSTGHVFNIQDAIGKEGLVYHQILKEKMGRITLNLNNITREIDAISHEDIPSFTRVIVINKENDTTVVVVALQEVTHE